MLNQINKPGKDPIYGSRSGLHNVNAGEHKESRNSYGSYSPPAYNRRQPGSDQPSNLAVYGQNGKEIAPGNSYQLMASKGPHGNASSGRKFRQGPSGSQSPPHKQEPLLATLDNRGRSNAPKETINLPNMYGSQNQQLGEMIKRRQAAKHSFDQASERLQTKGEEEPVRRNRLERHA